MKTMTCRQLGGSCDAPLHGETADEVIKAGDAHINEMAGKGDEEHKKLKTMMDDMKKNPGSGMDWYNKTKADFAAQPEE